MLNFLFSILLNKESFLSESEIHMKKMNQILYKLI